MDFLVAAWSIPNGKIRKFLLLLAIPVAVLAYFLGIDPILCAVLAVAIIWMLPHIFKGCVKKCLMRTATKNRMEASFHMRRALNFYRKDDYARAIVEYGMAISIDSDFMSAYNSRGALFSLQRQYDYAIVDYTSAIDIALKPNDLGLPKADNSTDDLISAYNGRGEAYFAKEQFDLAIDDFSAVIVRLSVLRELNAFEELRTVDEVSYFLARALDYRGRSYLAIGDYDSAASDFGSAIHNNPDKAIDYDSRFVSYADEARDKGKYDLAILGYTIGMYIKDETGYYNGRGLAYLAKGEYDLAIDDFQTARSIDPSGDCDLEIMGYTKAIAIEPDESTYYHNRSLCHLEKGEYDLAIADFETAISIDPSQWLDSENFVRKAYIKSGYTSPVILHELQIRVVGEYDPAEYDPVMAKYDAAIAGAPNNASGYMNRCLAYLAIGNYHSANADFNTAIRIAPENMVAYKNRIRIISQVIQHHKSGYYDLAIMEDAKAIDIDPNDFTGYYNRGLAYLEIGEYDSAIADFETVISIDPSHRLAQENLNKAYRAKEFSESWQ